MRYQTTRTATRGETVFVILMTLLVGFVIVQIQSNKHNAETKQAALNEMSLNEVTELTRSKFPTHLRENTISAKLVTREELISWMEIDQDGAWITNGNCWIVVMPLSENESMNNLISIPGLQHRVVENQQAAFKVWDSNTRELMVEGVLVAGNGRSIETYNLLQNHMQELGE